MRVLSSSFSNLLLSLRPPNHTTPTYGERNNTPADAVYPNEVSDRGYGGLTGPPANGP